MAKITFFDFIRSQWSRLPPVEKTDLTGKTIMVIGANAGIGFEVSKHFALMGPKRLILACRSRDKGEAALERLRSETGYKNAELWLVDLSEFASVIKFVDRFIQEGGRLDILVENAAIATRKYSTTVDGWEATMQVNCLSTFLIALRLLPILIKTGIDHATHPRLVIVSSGIHFWANIPKEVLNGDNVYKAISDKDFPTRGDDRYTNSKLFVLLFCQALNARLSPDFPVVVNSVDPGFCYSELRREVSGVHAITNVILEKAVAWTAEQGSRQLVYAAIGGKDDEMKGAYIYLAKSGEPSDFVISKEGDDLRQKLWKESLTILSEVDIRVREVVNTYLSDI